MSIRSFTFVQSNRGNVFSWEFDAVFINETNLLAINIILGNTDGFGHSIIVPIINNLMIVTTNFILNDVPVGIIYNATLLVCTTDGVQHLANCTQTNIMIETVVPTPFISPLICDNSIQLELKKPIIGKTESSGYSSVTDLILTVFYTDSSGVIHSLPFNGTNDSLSFSSNKFLIPQLVNDLPYDFAVIITNNIGVSGMSNSIEAIPNATPDVNMVVAQNIVSILNSPLYTNDQLTGIRLFITQPVSVHQMDSSGNSTQIPICEFIIKRLILNQSNIFSHDFSWSNPTMTLIAGQDQQLGTYNFDDTTCLLGSTYKYVISAKNKNGIGNSAESNQVICLTAAGAPSVSVVPDIDSAIITVNPSTLGGSTLNGYWVVVHGNTINIERLYTPTSNNKILVPGLPSGNSLIFTCQAVTCNTQLYGHKSVQVLTTPYKTPSSPVNIISTYVDPHRNLISSGLELTWKQDGLPSNTGGLSFEYNFYYSNESTFNSPKSIEPAIITCDMSNNFSAIFNNLIVGNTYYFKIQAMVKNIELDSYVFSPQSQRSDGSIVYSIPQKITSLTLTQCTDLNDRFMYDLVPGSVIVNNPTVNFTATLFENTVPITEWGLELGKHILLYPLRFSSTYYLIVRPFINISGYCYTGEETHSNTFAFYLPPSPPGNFALAARNNGINASWDLVTSPSNGVTIQGYKLYINNASMNGAPDYTVGPDVRYTVLEKFGSDSNYALVLNNTNYSVTIAAYGIVEVPDATVVRNILGSPATQNLITPTKNPSRPTNLNATTSDGKVTLTWTNIDSSVSGYMIIRQGASCIDIPEKNTLTYEITGLQLEHTYLFLVYSYLVINSQIIRSNNASQITVKVASSPDAITDFVSTRGNSLINLFWNPPNITGGAGKFGNGPLLYSIEVKNNSGVIINKIYDITEFNPYTITKLLNNVYYTVSIFAYFFAGDCKTLCKGTLFSSSAITCSLEPLPISNLQAVPSDKSVALSWTDPSDNYFKTLTVKILRDNRLLGSFNSASTFSTFTDTGLENGRLYTYTLIRVIDTNAQVTLQGQDEVFSTISAKPFGKPIVDTITSVELTDGGYTTFDVIIDNNGADLIGCAIICIPCNNISSVLVITDPTRMNEPAPSRKVKVSGSFIDNNSDRQTTVTVSSFVIIPYNAAGSVCVGYPEQIFDFGAPQPSGFV
jgi:hypothetical protein